MPPPGLRHPADAPGPLVFVADLAAVELADADDHHLRRVLRLRAGDPCTVADGRGSWRTAVVEPDGVRPTGAVVHTPSPAPALTVGVALLKGDKFEWVVQKLTELGVDRIVPVRAARSVVRWDAGKEAKAVTRLRQVARSAAEQCHRPDLPEVADVVDLAGLVRAGGPAVALAHRGGEAPSLARTTLLVGPEGGWDPAELALGAPTVALGGHVLRAETAAVTVGALWSALRAGLTAAAG